MRGTIETSRAQEADQRLLAKLKIDNIILYAEMMLNVPGKCRIDCLVSYGRCQSPFMIVAGSRSRIGDIGNREMQLQSANVLNREHTDMVV